MKYNLNRIALVLLSLALPGLILTFLFSGLVPAQADPPNIYRVAKTGDGTDGLTWPTAFTVVQDALGAAISGDEIWVATGVYTPGELVTDTFQLVNEVGLYGGFATTETLRTQRNWESNPTVLSGDIEGDDNTNANGVVTDTANISGDNSYHVVAGSGVFSSTVLDGFTITAGQANGSYLSPCGPKCGGGMYVVSGNPTLMDITFSGNLAYSGGGMYNISGSNPTLTNVTFSGNSAEFGGGIGNLSNSSPTLTNVTFSLNSAGDGGGMFNQSGSSPMLTTVTFSENSADRDGGGLYNRTDSNPTLTSVNFIENVGDNGGGIFNLYSSLTLTDVTFSGNLADGIGGGIYNDGNTSALIDVTFSGNSAFSGGGMYHFYGNLTLTNVIFSGNTALFGMGGGMYNTSPSSLTLTDVTFSGNWAFHDGGGMYNNHNNSPVLTNVTFSGNLAYGSGGGMSNEYNSPVLTNVTFSGNWAYAGGGGMKNYNSSPTLTNVTITGNKSFIGSGGGIKNYNGSPTVRNSIFWSNRDSSGTGTISANIANDSSVITLTHSLVQGSGGSGSWIGDASYVDGGNNLDTDPHFITPVDPNTAPTTDGNLRLSHFSPAIDVGNNSYVVGVLYDLDDKTRIINGVVDMGAYETFLYYFLPLVLR